MKGSWLNKAVPKTGIFDNKGISTGLKNAFILSGVTCPTSLVPSKLDNPVPNMVKAKPETV
ncbi:hypothetical protein D3C75_1346040 [compost metagenome]